MSTSVFCFTICAFVVTILIVAAMRYLSATNSARSKATSGEAYQELAQKAVAAQAEAAASISTLQRDLSDVGARLASVEKMLKDVG